jgi:long-chain acyl-CoA synthetase
MNTPTRLFDFPYYQLDHYPLQVSMSSRIAGQWKTFSTQDVVEKMNLLSKGLLKLGVKPGDRIALISHNNRSEWNMVDLGVMQIGAIDTPIYPTMTVIDYEYIINHAEAKYCFVSNEELYQKVQSIRDKIPTILEIYTFEEVAGAKNWNEVLELGKTGDQAEVDRLKSVVKNTDLATIIYTSGTTGKPKGVMLSHQNIASNAVASSDRLPAFNKGNARALSFLPACHIFERMLHYLYMYNGVTIYFAGSLDTIKEDLVYSKPNIFTAVPRLLEKFYDGILNKGRAAGGIKTKLFMWAVDVALQWQEDHKNGAMYDVKLAIARKLIFSKVKEALGLTEIQAVASGSAALAPRLARFFNAAGIPIFEGYGLTETSPVITVNTMNQANMLRIGYVGKVIKDVEIKIASDGEILCKGPNVMMGYYREPEKTAEILKDGWFYTGDIGVIEDGFLKITDRKKEMFKTSGGKYVAPQLIENALKESSYIEQCMVIGENQKFPAALVIPDFVALKLWCDQNQVPYTSHSELIQDKKIQDLIWTDIHKVNEKLGNWEQIKKIKLLPALFSIEGGELTPKLSLKRKPIAEKYKSEIEEIYS